MTNSVLPASQHERLAPAAFDNAPNPSRAHPLRIVSLAFAVALAGCGHPEPTIGTDTKARLAQALQKPEDPTSTLREQPARTAQQPVDPLTHATALVVAGQVDQGIKEAKAAFAADADDLALGLEVGRLAVKAGRLADAGEVYRKISRRHPRSVEALSGRGVVLAQQGDLNGAAEMFRKGLALRPHDVPTRNNLALVMLLRGETQTAVALLKHLKRSDRSPEVKALLALARERSRIQDAVQPAPGSELAPSLPPAATVPDGEPGQKMRRLAGTP